VRAVNLLPKDERRGRGESSSRRMQLLVAVPVLAIVLIAVGWLLTGATVKDDQSTLSTLQAQLDSMPRPKPTQRQSPALAIQHEQRVAALAGALSGRLAWDRVLRHISSVLPSDVWLTKLIAATTTASAPAPAPSTPATTTTTSSTTTTPTPTTPAALPSATSLEIDGYTYSQEAVARLLARLAVVPDLSDVQLKTSALSLIGKRTVVQFTITATVPQPAVTS
jgi:Tfp pilus assembly protein PilN